MTLFAIIAFVAAAAFLLLGINSMLRGGDYDAAHATRYMAARVGMQALAFVLLLLAMLATRH
jgi:hypothetical protein